LRVLTWNLFHGRSQPPAGRPLAAEFASTLAGWDWDVALLQEVPPWWPPQLARIAGAEHRAVLTSRNWGPAVRRAISARNPDILEANGGGANAILVRGPIRGHARVRLTFRPERRVAHGVALGDGTWVVNLHASTHPGERTVADLRKALDRALAWSAEAPLVFGGDLNRTRPSFREVEKVAGHHVDHLFVRGLIATGPGEVLDAGALSDHKPLAVTLGG
jgi:endonuclease/exonuclease/phosphatase family metal-dependent hydrolase